MTDNAPKPLTAPAGPEELLTAAKRLSDTLPNVVNLPTDRTFELATQLSIAAALVAAIDRNTEATKGLREQVDELLENWRNP